MLKVFYAKLTSMSWYYSATCFVFVPFIYICTCSVCVMCIHTHRIFHIHAYILWHARENLVTTSKSPCRLFVWQRVCAVTRKCARLNSDWRNVWQVPVVCCDVPI